MSIRKYSGVGKYRRLRPVMADRRNHSGGDTQQERQVRASTILRLNSHYCSWSRLREMCQRWWSTRLALPVQINAGHPGARRIIIVCTVNVGQMKARKKPRRGHSSQYDCWSLFRSIFFQIAIKELQLGCCLVFVYIFPLICGWEESSRKLNLISPSMHMSMSFVFSSVCVCVCLWNWPRLIIAL